MGMPGNPTGATVAGVEEVSGAGVDTIRAPVMVRVVYQVLPFGVTTVAEGSAAGVWTLASLTAGRLLFACPLNQFFAQAVVGTADGRGVVVLAPALLTLGELTFVCAFDLVAAQAVCRLTGESVVVVLALALLTLGELTFVCPIELFADQTVAG